MTVSNRRYKFLVVSSALLWVQIFMYVTPRIIPFLFSTLTNDDQYFNAASDGRSDILEPYLAGGGNPEAEKGIDGTLLQLAVGGDWLYGPPHDAQFDTVALLLSYGANPNPYVYDGTEAPLVRAAEYCNYETFAMLIAAGADPGTVLTSGETIQTILERKFVPDRRKKRWLLNAALDKRRQAEKTQTAPDEAADEAGPDEG